MTIDKIQHLHELLLKMQKADPDFRVFGSTRHQYRLGPPLSESELLAFEQKHRVKLPEDYRFFLKEVGNGNPTRFAERVSNINAGAGPGYGLLPLEEAVLGSDLSKPFPFKPSPSGEPVQGSDEWGDEEPWPGVLEIVHHGCTSFSYLVVNGPAYGTVWGAEINQVIFYPTGLTFEAWYRRWLDRLVERALPMLARERVVKQVGVGMTKAQVIGICGGQWKLSDFGTGLRFLRFTHLATEFQLNENDVVVRIVDQSIGLGI